MGEETTELGGTIEELMENLEEGKQRSELDRIRDERQKKLDEAKNDSK